MGDRECTKLTACKPTEYQSEAATVYNDRACTTRTDCGATMYISNSESTELDSQCEALTVCGGVDFQSTPSTSSTDRACSVTTTCSDSEYQTEGATTTSDRRCKRLTECNEREYEDPQATPVSDRQCKAYPAKTPTKPPTEVLTKPPTTEPTKEPTLATYPSPPAFESTVKGGGNGSTTRACGPECVPGVAVALVALAVMAGVAFKLCKKQSATGDTIGPIKTFDTATHLQRSEGRSKSPTDRTLDLVLDSVRRSVSPPPIRMAAVEAGVMDASDSEA